MSEASRIRTLIALGFLPQDAATIVHDKLPENPYLADDYVRQLDLLHAATFLRYADLVPNQLKDLWDAQPLPP